MAFDGIITRAMAHELDELLRGGKVEKIYQPEKDELLFVIHAQSGRLRVAASCNNERAGIFVSEETYENPSSPPSFCMLLRKHIQSSHIGGVRQVNSERIIEIDFETKDEMGYASVKQIIVETMGRHSNIILVNKSDDRIIDSIKHVSIDESRARQILPGGRYSYPPAQDKIPFDRVTESDIATFMTNRDAGKALLDHIGGISHAVAREIASNEPYEAGHAGEAEPAAKAAAPSPAADGPAESGNPATEMPTEARDPAAEEPDESGNSTAKMPAEEYLTEGLNPAAVMRRLNAINERIRMHDFAPCVWLKEGGVPVDFHVIPLRQYDERYKRIDFASVSSAVSWYYEHKASSGRMMQKRQTLARSITSLLKKLRLKKQRLSEDLLKAENSEMYRLYGELITANIHSIKTGAPSAIVNNYYTGEPIEIPLDVRYAPAKNAQLYFKKYGKSKTAIVEKQKQIDETDTDIMYLESVLALAENAAHPEDIDALRAELLDGRYLRMRKKAQGPKKKEKYAPLSFKTSDGCEILVGRTGKENDYLTTKRAKRTDLWFHTKDIPGSHVILLADGRAPSETAIFDAAKVAAWYSKGRDSENVPVDYTEIKYVKKPSGAKPGMVTFTNNRTVYVTPKAP